MYLKDRINNRGNQLALTKDIVQVPGDALSYKTAGYAKIMCSAVFVTGLSPAFAAEHVGYFTAPYADRAKVSFPEIDYQNKKYQLNFQMVS